MVGFTLLSRSYYESTRNAMVLLSYYYLRRRSHGPPFPPDHRQAGERGVGSDHPVHLYCQQKGTIFPTASFHSRPPSF